MTAVLIFWILHGIVLLGAPARQVLTRRFAEHFRAAYPDRDLLRRLSLPAANWHAGKVVMASATWFRTTSCWHALRRLLRPVRPTGFPRLLPTNLAKPMRWKNCSKNQTPWMCRSRCEYRFIVERIAAVLSRSRARTRRRSPSFECL